MKQETKDELKVYILGGLAYLAIVAVPLIGAFRLGTF